jgi:hypothetical protein
MNLLDLEFLATGSERYRYPLEKNGHGRKQRHCKQEESMPTLLKDNNLLAIVCEGVFKTDETWHRHITSNQRCSKTEWCLRGPFADLPDLELQS